jgi:pimeloyl-ACP methyl ester carboxylesterase
MFQISCRWFKSTQPSVLCIALIQLTTLLAGCIRPQNYHPNNSSIISYRYRSDDSQGYGTNYFNTAKPSVLLTHAYECYIEFDARGSMYRDRVGTPTQLNAAVDLIKAVKQSSSGSPQRIAVYVFVHGWKNNASEDAGNVWGFRRFLSDVAAQSDIPIIGVYMGWPGASLKNDQFLSFWNREPIADNVGQSSDFRNALRSVLQAAKGDSYDSPERSIAVVIGHSFGGIVLEHAATDLLEEQIAKPGNVTDETGRAHVQPPADLFVLVNEAGASAIALPFLLQLKEGAAEYECSVQGEDRDCPLLLSMTSVGDVATKFAYPGGEFLSFNRSKTASITPPDDFGQSSTLPYNLLTAANMVALQSHQIIRLTGSIRCDKTGQIPIRLSASETYCMEPSTSNSSRNHTPYWIMQLPQVFVPDHSTVFRDSFLNLLADMLVYEGLIPPGVSNRTPIAKSSLFRAFAPRAAGPEAPNHSTFTIGAQQAK